MRFDIKKWAFILGTGLFLSPALAFAQELTGVRNLLNTVVGIVNILIPLCMALAVLAFFWGLVRILFSNKGAEANSEGKTLMIWGVVTLFVMAAVWGIIQFIAGNLGVGTGGTVVPPSVQTQQF